MPMRVQGLPYQVEDFASQGPTHRYYYLFDPATGEWLTPNVQIYQFGRNNASVGNQYLRAAANTTCTATHGPGLLHISKVVGLTIQSQVTVQNQLVEIWQTTMQHSIAWHNTTALNVTLDVDLAAGPFSIYLNAAPTGPPWTPASFPICAVYVVWRLT
jgi:hypothetical protein